MGKRKGKKGPKRPKTNKHKHKLDVESQKKINKKGLQDSKKEALAIHRRLLARTTVNETLTLRQIDGLYGDLVRLLQIPLENVRVFDVDYQGTSDDEGEQRGGFCAKEALLISHVAASTKKSLDMKRSHYRMDCKEREKYLHIVRDAKRDTTFIHLANCMTDAAYASREFLAHFMESNNNLWCKGCSFSGKPNLQALDECVVRNKLARESYFGQKSADKVEINDIRVKKEYVGKSAEFSYQNANGQFRTFQAGNPIDRGVYPTKQLLKKGGEPYLKEAHNILAMVGPFIHIPSKKGEQNHGGGKGELPKLEAMKLAFNQIPEGHSSGRAWHRDSYSPFPTIISAHGGPVELQSKEKNNADAGMLVHELGGIIHGYGERDYFIFSGNNLHTPVPPTPAHRNSRKSSKDRDQLPAKGKKKREKAVRRSFVLFYKK